MWTGGARRISALIPHPQLLLTLRTVRRLYVPSVGVPGLNPPGAGN